jgi:hypothetical protein
MLDKLLNALIPVGVTFGPLFMTDIAGAAPAAHLRLVGIVLLTAALIQMLRTIESQQREVKRLRTGSGV